MSAEPLAPEPTRRTVAATTGDASLDHGPVGPVGSADGRRRRGQRSRDGVIDAILELVAEGNERPTTAEIAERSDVSVRSVFRHFDDVESLYAEALAVHSRKIAPLYDFTPPSGELDRRIDALVEHRVVLFESTAPVRRLAERLRSRSPVIAEGLDFSRVVLRAQVEQSFRPELDLLDVPARTQLLDGLEVTSSWYTWDALTRSYGHDRHRTSAIVADTLRAMLG